MATYYSLNTYFFDNADLPPVPGYQDYALGQETDLELVDEITTQVVYIISTELSVTTPWGNIEAQYSVYPGLMESDGYCNTIIDYEDGTFAYHNGAYTQIPVTATATIRPSPEIDGSPDEAGYVYLHYGPSFENPYPDSMQIGAGFWTHYIKTEEAPISTPSYTTVSTGDELYYFYAQEKQDFKIIIDDYTAFLMCYPYNLSPILYYNSPFYSYADTEVPSISISVLNPPGGYYYFRVSVDTGKSYTISLELL